MARVVVVGTGPAAVSTAVAMREGGSDDDVVLVGAEPEEPYDRPPLSKDVLAGAPAPLLREPGWWAEARVALRTGTAAVGLDLAGRALLLAGGERLPFDRLVLATGAEPVLPAPLAGPGVHVLRSLADARGLRTALRPGARLVVVGAGWVGSEVAWAAAGLGAQVALVDALSDPLAPLVSPPVAVDLLARHAGRGVRLLLGRRAAAVERDGARPTGVRLDDGELLPADAVLVGLGVRPATGWLAGSGLALGPGGGVLVDEAQRSSDPAVLAVGDAAEAPGRPGGHWQAAVDDGAAAAAVLLGEQPPARRPPSAWTEQGGVRVQVLGRVRDGQPVAADERDGARRLVVLGAEGAPEAVVAVDWPQAAARWRRRLVAA